MSAIIPTFSGELQLAGWSETHNGGAKVTFWLQSADDLEVFKTLTAKKGNTAGHRLMAVMVEVGDDELPVQPAPAEDMGIPMPRAHIGDCCYRTVMWCAEPQFWVFLNQAFPSADTVTNAREAGELVKFMCTVNSRKELDTDNEANKSWHRLIREPYRVYLETQKR